MPDERVQKAKKLRNMSPQDYISDAFPTAQQATQVQALRGAKGGLPTSSLGTVMGAYDPDTNVIQVDPKANAGVTVHEAGHAIWDNDITPEQQQQWKQLHMQNRQLSSVAKYPLDPGHSFAESYGMFAQQPEQLKKNAPDVYKFLTNLSGFEYARDLFNR